MAGAAGHAVPAEWFRRAAEAGFAPAQFQLGVLYCVGRGVEKNLEDAVRWYELAAAQKHDMAMYNLGVMLLQGMGVEANPARGAQLMEESGLTPQAEGAAPAVNG